ncbi:MAG: hypothetical protein SGCHY_005434 [Lobulomycetales sp.]
MEVIPHCVQHTHRKKKVKAGEDGVCLPDDDNVAVHSESSVRALVIAIFFLFKWNKWDILLVAHGAYVSRVLGVARGRGFFEAQCLGPEVLEYHRHLDGPRVMEAVHNSMVNRNLGVITKHLTSSKVPLQSSYMTDNYTARKDGLSEKDVILLVKRLALWNLSRLSFVYGEDWMQAGERAYSYLKDYYPVLCGGDNAAAKLADLMEDPLVSGCSYHYGVRSCLNVSSTAYMRKIVNPTYLPTFEKKRVQALCSSEEMSLFASISQSVSQFEKKKRIEKRHLPFSFAATGDQEIFEEAINRLPMKYQEISLVNIGLGLVETSIRQAVKTPSGFLGGNCHVLIEGHQHLKPESYRPFLFLQLKRDDKAVGARLSAKKTAVFKNAALGMANLQGGEQWNGILSDVKLLVSDGHNSKLNLGKNIPLLAKACGMLLTKTTFTRDCIFILDPQGKFGIVHSEFLGTEISLFCQDEETETLGSMQFCEASSVFRDTKTRQLTGNLNVHWNISTENYYGLLLRQQNGLNDGFTRSRFEGRKMLSSERRRIWEISRIFHNDIGGFIDGAKFMPGSHPHLLLSGHFASPRDGVCQLVTDQGVYSLVFEDDNIMRDLVGCHHDEHPTRFKFEKRNGAWEMSGCNPKVGLKDDEAKKRPYCGRFEGLAEDGDTLPEADPGQQSMERIKILDTITMMKKASACTSSHASSSFHARIGEVSIMADIQVNESDDSHMLLKNEMLRNGFIMDKARFLQLTGMVLQRLFSSLHDLLSDRDGDLELSTTFLEKHSIQMSVSFDRDSHNADSSSISQEDLHSIMQLMHTVPSACQEEPYERTDIVRILAFVKKTMIDMGPELKRLVLKSLGGKNMNEAKSVFILCTLLREICADSATFCTKTLNMSCRKGIRVMWQSEDGAEVRQMWSMTAIS